MEVITVYTGPVQLKKLIIAAYIKEIEAEANILEKILSDPKWASDKDSEYHKEIRERYSAMVKEAKRQIKLIKI